MPFGPNAINTGYGQSQNNPTGISNEVIPQNPAQTPGNFVITGGSIDGTPIGITTPAAGKFTTLSADSVTLTNPLPIVQGGTGASTATAALTALGAYPASNPSNYTSNTGTVTSVSASGGTTGMSFNGSPITSSGTFTLAGTLAVANGGTGSTTASDARTALGVSSTGSDTTYAFRANNLSDLASAATARTNLGLGTVATQTAPSGTNAQLLANDGSGGFSNVTVGSGLTYSGGTLSSTGGGGSGTVTSVSVTSANGFAGTVSNSTTTAAISLSTTVTGLLKGNGTAVSAASAGTDYEVPLTFSTGLTRSTNTVTVNTSQNISTLSNLTSNGFVKTSGGTGALSIDTNTYLTTAVTNLAGTANEITASASTGSVTLSIPSAVTFTGKTVTGGTFNSGAFNGTFGATTPSTGAFTTLSATGKLSGGGTTTNDNASAGQIGEYVEGNLNNASKVTLSSGVAANTVSISLTAGDWDVSGVAYWQVSGATPTSYYATITSSSATIGSSNTGENFQTGATIATAAQVIGSGIPPTRRFSLASTTTIYLVVTADFISGTTWAYGTLRARRAR